MKLLDLVARIEAQRKVPRARQDRSWTSLLRGIDLFSGAGGFTIGAVRAGLPISLAVERDSAASQTARRAGHRVEAMEVADVDKTEEATLYGVEVVIGGPPCQPFSSMGHRKGQYDPRDGFPLVLGALESLWPRRMVIENVRDFLAPKFAAYRDQVIDDLSRYFAHVGVWELNAKDFGVPQDRHRIFLWGAEVELQPPVPTHGPRTGVPYVTTRQALPGLESPAIHVRATTARSRSIDVPAPTVTTKGTMYTAVREGLIYGRDRAVGRRLTVPELGALQGFPGAFEFTGRLGDQYKQVGNAVPPALGEAVVRAVLAGMVARRLSPSAVLEVLLRENPEAWLLEPREHLDVALVGVTNTSRWAGGKMVAVYSERHVVDIVVDLTLESERGKTWEEAEDEERDDALADAHAWIDSIESGFVTRGPWPVIQRFDPDRDEGFDGGEE